MSALHRAARRAVVAATLAVVACAAAALVASPAVAATSPTVTFDLLTPLPGELDVGETAVIGVRVTSSEPFAMAIALSDAYYPGRAVRFDGSAAVANAVSADLYLTLTARAPTAGLGAVQDWPVDEGWPAGVAPLAIRVGARFAGGQVVGATFPFALTVR